MVVKFYIERTSQWDYSRPCDSAFREIVDDEERWFVSISCIDDLKKLQKEVGSKLIVDFNGYFFVNGKAIKSPTIEIYDHYRE